MAKNPMKSAWETKRKEDERVQKVRAKKQPEISGNNSKATEPGVEVTESRPE